MRVRALLLVAVASVASVVTLPSIASAACAAPSSKYYGGTVKGADGLDVNVQVSIALATSAGVRIGMDGCRTPGYAINLGINKTTSAKGAVHTSATTSTWRVNNLPSNVGYAWIELWPRDPERKLNYSKYSGSMRRRILPSRGDIRLTLPVVCAAGGKTGGIYGRSFDKAGRAVTVSANIHAWSEAPDSQTFVMGFGPGKAYNGNYYQLPNLASGQYYTILANAPGYPEKRIEHVYVHPCKWSGMRITFG